MHTNATAEHFFLFEPVKGGLDALILNFCKNKWIKEINKWNLFLTSKLMLKQTEVISLDGFPTDVSSFGWPVKSLPTEYSKFETVSQWKLTESQRLLLIKILREIPSLKGFN